METGSKGDVREIPPMEIKNLLKEINFPAKKNEIMEKARRDGAISNMLLENLGMLPDKEYASADEVIKELEK